MTEAKDIVEELELPLVDLDDNEQTKGEMVTKTPPWGSISKTKDNFPNKSDFIVQRGDTWSEWKLPYKYKGQIHCGGVAAAWAAARGARIPGGKPMSLTPEETARLKAARKTCGFSDKEDEAMGDEEKQEKEAPQKEQETKFESMTIPTDQIKSFSFDENGLTIEVVKGDEKPEDKEPADESKDDNKLEDVEARLSKIEETLEKTEEPEKKEDEMEGDKEEEKPTGESAENDTPEPKGESGQQAKEEFSNMSFGEAIVGKFNKGGRK